MSEKLSYEAAQDLVAAGRVVSSWSTTFGQTAAGCHSAVTAEEAVSKDTVLQRPRDGHFWFDPATGRFWAGSPEVFRVLPEAGAPLAQGKVIFDQSNRSWQKAMLK